VGSRCLTPVRPVLLDTYAAICLMNGDPISDDSRASHAVNLGVHVSPISAWEIGSLVAKNRLQLTLSPDPRLLDQCLGQCPSLRPFRTQGGVGGDATVPAPALGGGERGVTPAQLRMSSIYSLVVGRADKGLERIPKFHRMLSTDMQIEQPSGLETLDQLEMVGYVVPRDQQKLPHPRVAGAVRHELENQGLRVIQEGRNDIDMGNDLDLSAACRCHR
jgi:hypothetical protein